MMTYNMCMAYRHAVMEYIDDTMNLSFYCYLNELKRMETRSECLELLMKNMQGIERAMKGGGKGKGWAMDSLKHAQDIFLKAMMDGDEDFFKFLSFIECDFVASNV
jgi:hypothetical protein